MKPSGKIRFLCPHCGKAVGVSAQHAGKRGRCPGCGAVIRTPAAEALAPAREPAAVEESRPRGPSLPLDLARRGWKPYRFKDSDVVVFLPERLAAGFGPDGVLYGSTDGESAEFSA